MSCDSARTNQMSVLQLSGQGERKEESKRDCFECGNPAVYEHQGKAYCKGCIGTVTLKNTVFSRVVGYYAGVENMAKHKQNEVLIDRKEYSWQKAQSSIGGQRNQSNG